jgi:hypothetical protein
MLLKWGARALGLDANQALKLGVTVTVECRRADNFLPGTFTVSA